MKYLNKTSAIGENTADNRFDSSNVVSNRDGSLLERTEYLVQQSNPLADFILIDKDIFDVADADANNERWNIGYITGTEGGSADINTTTSGKLMVTVDPDATPTEARYAVNKALAVMGDVWKVTVDLSLTWGTMGTTGCAAGIILSKTTTYDATNYFHFERAKTSTTNRLTLSGKLNNAAISAVTPITLADDVVALKIERWGETYRFYYSATQNPDETWVLFTEVEDASNYMTNQIGIFLEAYSKGSTTNETIVADFDNFQLFAGAGGGSIELTGDYDSTWTTVNKDGNVFERLEGIDSDLTVIQSNIAADVISDLNVILSNITADIQSDLNVVLSNLLADVQSDIATLSSDIIATTNSDIVVIQSDIAALRTHITSDVAAIKSDLVGDIQSDLNVVLSNLLADVQSDIATLASDIVATTDSDIAAIQSNLAVLDAALDSDIVVLRADFADVTSDIAVVLSNLLADVQSDIATLFSDIVATTNSDIVQIISDLRLVDSNLSDVQSDLVIVQSDLKAFHSVGGHLASKTITYDGSVSYAAFTVTGVVAVKCIGHVTGALSNHGDATSVGTATSAAGLIAATAGTAMQTVDQIWVDNSPSDFETFPASYSVISENIAVVGTANLATGTVELYLIWIPLSSDGAIA